MKYVDRGDPVTFDFSNPNFIFDSAWHSLDLSGIVPPAGANQLVHISLTLVTSATAYWYIRETGNVNNINRLSLQPISAGNWELSGWVMMDAVRKIDYYLAWTGITVARLSIRGWMEPVC